ncbi:MAG: Fur family transcriptional regulator [Pseudomonadota bacterium]
MRKSGQITQQEVLDILSAQSKPLTAYEILAVMKESNAKTAPPTVYRALNALVEKGAVHRIESLNAFMACCHDHDGDMSVMTICDDCGSVEEQAAPQLINSLDQVSGQAGFKAKRHVIELHGQCASCDTEDR